MEISLVTIKAESRHVLENLFPYYIYDMSEYMGWSPNENGHFSFNKSSLDAYWKQEDHEPFFIYADGELAGFVLVRKYPSKGIIYDIEQFFVLRKRQKVSSTILNSSLFFVNSKVKVLVSKR